MKAFAAIAAAAALAAPYRAPRTPWGDPDLQGNYTNKYEYSAPLERPDEFAGRRIEDLAAAELAAVLETRDRQVLARPEAVGPLQFRDAVDVTKGSRPLLIVDPPGGHMPPMTPEAVRRLGPASLSQDTGLGGVLNSRRGSTGSFGAGPFDSIEDFT